MAPSFKNMLLDFHKNEDGANATEYIILLILIACIIIAMVAAFGSVLKQKYTDGKNTVDTQVVISN